MRLTGLLLLFASCTVLQNNDFVGRAGYLANGHNYVYRLPYKTGQRFRVAQGYQSLFSHYGNYAIDFKMPIGTPVLAARGGVVVAVRQDDSTHGIHHRNVGTGNGVTIRHADGTYAHYWHLKQNGVLVSVGDSISEGQQLALSGNTGFTAFPHLHFEVTRTPKKGKTDFPVLFFTEKGPRYLQPLRRYKAL